MDATDLRSALQKLVKTGHSRIDREDLVAACRNARVPIDKVIAGLLSSGLVYQKSIDDDYFQIAGAENVPKSKVPSCPEIEEQLVSSKGADAITPALIVWHQYKSPKPPNYEPIALRALAKWLALPKSTVSDFFHREFGGYKKYVAACKQQSALIGQLRRLNEEMIPEALMTSLSDCEPV